MKKKSNANVSSRYHLTCRLSMSATAFSLMTSKDSWWSGSGPSPDFLFYSLNHISWFSKVHMDVVQPGVSANHVSTHLRIRIRGKSSRRSMASKLNHRFNPGHRCRSKQPQNYLHLSGSLYCPPWPLCGDEAQASAAVLRGWECLWIFENPFNLAGGTEEKNRGTAISVGGIYLATFLKSPFEQEWGAWWCSLWQNVTLTERHIGHAHSRTGICGDTWLLSFLCPSFSSVNTSSFFFFPPTKATILEVVNPDFK